LSFRQIKKKLDGRLVAEPRGRATVFRAPEALALIYEAKEKIAGGLDPLFEKARLDKARADKIELELKLKRGEVVERSEVDHEWGELIAALRAKILAVPRKVAPQVHASESVSECEKILKGAVREALLELSSIETLSDSETFDEANGSSIQGS